MIPMQCFSTPVIPHRDGDFAKLLCKNNALYGTTSSKTFWNATIRQ